MDKFNPAFQDQGIVFAAVDPNYKSHVKEGHIHFFPSEHELKMYRLERRRKDVVYLNEIADKNCPKCHGTGRDGIKRVPLPKSKDEIAEQIVIYFDEINKEGIDEAMVRENFLSNMVAALKFPESFKKPLRILMGVAKNQLIDEGIEKKKQIAERFAIIIDQDFRPSQVIWCECFAKNLEKEVKKIKQLTQFSLN